MRARDLTTAPATTVDNNALAGRAIAVGIRRRLEIYGGLDRIADTVHDSADHHVAAVKAQAMPGVVDTRALPTRKRQE